MRASPRTRIRGCLGTERARRLRWWEKRLLAPNTNQVTPSLLEAAFTAPSPGKPGRAR